MAGLIESKLSDAEFTKFCDELLALQGAGRTLKAIQDLARSHGIEGSRMAASTFRDGPLARYRAKLENGRATREALCAAAGAGQEPLAAIEAAMVLELEDYIGNAEKLDLNWVTNQLVKLRGSISQRESQRQMELDLKRKLADSESARHVGAERLALLLKRLDLAQFDAVKAAIKHAKEIRAALGDGSLDGDARAKRVHQILFGERPADWTPITAENAEGST